MIDNREVDVREFGALGDGAAIQAAEDWASSEAIQGGTIYIPPGDWETDGLTKSVRTKWRGMGPRHVDSATEARETQNTRIVGQVDGAIITVQGLGSNSILQRGAISDMQIKNESEVTYPAAIGVEFVDDVKEHMMSNVLINGGEYGIKATSNPTKGAALYFDHIYTSSVTGTGIFIDTYSDCWLSKCQFSGGNYGAHFVNCSSFNSDGVRYQSSPVNLRVEDSGFMIFADGSCDTGSGNGMEIVDCHTTRIDGYIFYSNGQAFSHLLIEATDGGVCSGIYVDASFFPSLTQTAVTLEKNSTGDLRWVSIGGDMRSMTNKVAGDAIVSLSIRPGTMGATAEQYGAMKFKGDIGFYTATPIAKQTGVAVTAAGIHAALVNLGLIGA